jgi:hypothetical protein
MSRSSTPRPATARRTRSQRSSTPYTSCSSIARWHHLALTDPTRSGVNDCMVKLPCTLLARPRFLAAAPYPGRVSPHEGPRKPVPQCQASPQRPPLHGLPSPYHRHVEAVGGPAFRRQPETRHFRGAHHRRRGHLSASVRSVWPQGAELRLCGRFRDEARSRCWMRWVWS